jgi:uncharacterized membrane protein YhaH (DUF805 family)
MNPVNLFFGFSGRISRSQFWIGLLAIAAVELAAMRLLGVPFFPEEISPFPVRLRDSAIQLVTLYPTAAVLVKRLHDRDYSGQHAAWFIGLLLAILVTGLFGLTGDPNNMNWLDYALGFAILVVGLAFLIDLGLRRGVAGANEFGPDPLAAGAAGPDG